MNNKSKIPMTENDYAILGCMIVVAIAGLLACAGAVGLIVWVWRAALGGLTL